MMTNIQTLLKRFIPGVITAALVFGPSKVTITSKMGATYGYSMLWVVVVAIFFMYTFSEMATRIGMSSDKTLLAIIREKYGRIVASAIGVGIFLVATSFQAGNSIGVGIAVGEATGTPPYYWIIAFNLFGITLLFFKQFYKTLERLMISLIVLMLAAFLATLFFADIKWRELFTGFIPSVPPGSVGLLIAFMASCFSLVGAFYQAYLVQENKSKRVGTKSSGQTLVGMVMLGVMSAVLIICAAAALHPQGISVDTASDMAGALAPLFGSYASGLFLLGLFGASFSSLIGNATLGGSLLMDAFGFGAKLDSLPVKLAIAAVMVAGVTIALGYGSTPLELIIFAQSVTVFLVPFIGITMYTVANDAKFMGGSRNSPSQQLTGALGLLVIILLAAWNFYELFVR